MTQTSPARPGKRAERGRAMPRAVIHRRILDEAESRPTASHPQLAAAIGGASVSLVKRVLNEYGDPGGQRNGETPSTDVRGGGGDTSARERDAEPNCSETPNEFPSLTDVSIQQQQTLRGIYDHPDATQRDLAEVLGVSAATVCQRMKSIEGFEWSDRRSFVSKMFGSNEDLPSRASYRADDGPRTAVDSKRAPQRNGSSGTLPTGHDEAADFAGIDRSLAHKIIHVCIQSEYISWEEERKIIEGLMNSPNRR